MAAHTMNASDFHIGVLPNRPTSEITAVLTTNDVLRTQPDMVAAVFRALRRRLDAIHTATARQKAPEVLGDVPPVSESVAEERFGLSAHREKVDGRVPRERLEADVARLSAELTMGTHVSVEAVEDLSLLGQPARRWSSTTRRLTHAGGLA